jgi:hypothetical protein
MNLLEDLPVELYIIIFSYLDYGNIYMLKMKKITWYQLAIEKWGHDHKRYPVKDSTYENIFYLESLIGNELGLSRSKFIREDLSKYTYVNTYHTCIRIDKYLFRIDMIGNLCQELSYFRSKDNNDIYLNLKAFQNTMICKMILLHAKLI